MEKTQKEENIEKLSVCDIGCGSGKNLEKFSSLGFDIFGVEPDKDLEKWGELWEDFYDVLISKQRKDEEEISWEDLKQELETENNSHD